MGHVPACGFSPRQARGFEMWKAVQEEGSQQPSGWEVAGSC